MRRSPRRQDSKKTNHCTAIMLASSEEHTTSGLINPPDEKAVAYETQPDWTPQEEAKAKRK